MDSTAHSALQPPRSGDRRALYLRWRPGRFADVLGQEHVTRTLRNAVATEQVAHAYLLCGPRGTGKTSIARILFKAINCEAPVDGDACDTCESCRAVTAGRALDLVEIDAASNRGIDHIRDLREKVWISPSQARRKMYILDEAHQLSAPAWDAFLKTLEEPPPHAVFVLATTEVHKVPATILSRCQRFDLGRIALGDLASYLQTVVAAEQLQADAGVLQRVARLARGGVRDALSTLDQLVAYGGDTITVQAAREVLGLTAEESLRRAAEALARQDARAALELVGELAREGADLRQFLDDLVEYLRALLLARLGASDVLAFEFGAEEQAWLEAQAAAWTPGRLVELVRRISAVDAKGRDAGQLQVQLEVALLDAALGGESPPVAPPRLGGGAGSEAPLAVSPVGVVPGTTAVAPSLNGPVDHATPAPGATAPATTAPDPSPPPQDWGGPGGGHPGILAEERAEWTVEVADPPSPSDAAPPSASNGGAPAGLDVAIVRHRWTDLKEAVAAQLPRAAIALEAASVAGVRDGELLLAFTNDFLQRTIEADGECRAAIETVLVEQLGVALRPRCVPADAHQPALPGDEFLQRAVELFGATGVERVDDESSRGEERAS